MREQHSEAVVNEVSQGAKPSPCTLRMGGMQPFWTAVADFIPRAVQVFANHWLTPKLVYDTASSSGDAIANPLLLHVPWKMMENKYARHL